jgi:hypothetical protein
LEHQWKQQLKHIPVEILLLHEDWYRSHRLLSTKRKNIILKYDRDRAEMVQCAKTSIENFRQERRLYLEKEKENIQSEINRQRLHEHLKILRETRNILNDQLHQQTLKEWNVKQTKQSLKEEQEKKKQEYRKMRVALFNEAKQKIAMENQKREEEYKTYMNKIRQTNIVKNIPKVQARQVLLIEKKKRSEKLEMEIQAREQRRLQYLMELVAQSLPYWVDIQNATAKLDHVTAAVKAQEYQGYEEATRGHYSATGYADGKIIGMCRCMYVASCMLHDSCFLLLSFLMSIFPLAYNPPPSGNSLYCTVQSKPTLSAF